MNWITKLYEDTKKMWIEKGKDENGYAIFYSPVTINPTIALIGYNPGGDENSFNENEVGVPNVHEYFKEDYKLAKNVKFIFEQANLTSVLKDSVKFNLIFFRSKTAKEFQDKDLIKFSEEKVVEILQELKPKYIITEGFATFERLKKLLNGTEVEPIQLGKNAILTIGKTGDGTPIFGMIHPSGAHGISTEILKAIGDNLKILIKP